MMSKRPSAAMPPSLHTDVCDLPVGRKETGEIKEQEVFIGELPLMMTEAAPSSSTVLSA